MINYEYILLTNIIYIYIYYMIVEFIMTNDELLMNY